MRRAKGQTTPLEGVYLGPCCDTGSMITGCQCPIPFVESVVGSQWVEKQSEPLNT